jgi:hypothetical protein
MAVIKGLAGAKSKIGEFSFCEFRRVRELRFSEIREGERTSYNLYLTVVADDRTPQASLRIELTGVCELSVSGFGNAPTRIIGLDIEDISNRQWEGIAWELVDFENEDIHCYAQDVAVVVVPPPE